jgi:hypothetical protein
MIAMNKELPHFDYSRLREDEFEEAFPLDVATLAERRDPVCGRSELGRGHFSLTRYLLRSRLGLCRRCFCSSFRPFVTAREKDRGSANSSAIRATDDALSCCSARSGGQGFVFSSPSDGIDKHLGVVLATCFAAPGVDVEEDTGSRDDIDAPSPAVLHSRL